MLVLSRKKGEVIRIGEDIEVTIVGASGRGLTGDTKGRRQCQE